MNVPGVHYPHRIRLRGPWQSEPVAYGTRWVRRFGYPGRIDADERVWLTFQGFAGRVELVLNRQPLGCHEKTWAFEHDVTPLLALRNELIIKAAGSDALGEVGLEIRRTAFLRGVQAALHAGRLRITGSVVGSAERPLELYVLLDGHSVHYAMIEPMAEGRPFDVVIEERGEEVRVELVDGGSVWYAVVPPLAA